MRQRQQRQQQNQTMIIWKKCRKCVENICAVANICAQTTGTHALAMRTTANTHRTKENQSMCVCVCHAVLRSVPFCLARQATFACIFRWKSIQMDHFLCVYTHSTVMARECASPRGDRTHRVYRVNRRAWIFPAFSFTATLESSERRSVFRERVLLWLLPNAHSKINSVSTTSSTVVSFVFCCFFLLSFVLYVCSVPSHDINFLSNLVNVSCLPQP